MLGGTMKNLQQILKQSSFIVCTTTTTHIRTISSGSRGAVAAKNFRLLLPQQDKQQQHHGGGIILGAPCHTKPSAVVGETIKRLLHHHRVSVPCINTSTTTTGKRGFCSVVGDHATREITVKNSSVGRIIGKGGQTVRGIEMDSGANIHISDRDEFDSTRDRLITITGSSEQIEHAVQLIEEAVPRVIAQVGGGLDEQNQNYSRGPSAIITVSDIVAGFLIGRRGERKKRMEEQSGARINIAQRNDESNDGERMVAVSGGNEQVELALKLINEAILAHEGTANDDILEHSGDNFAVKKMSVSHNIAGTIIGVAAENLRQLESKSGADIRLPRGDPPSGTRDRVVVISGAPKQVQLAQELIEELIKEHGLSASDGDVERTDLRVKDDVAGFLIGHRGETLAEIQQTSGARISINSKLETPDFAVTGERVVMISGTSEQIERAQDLIRTCLQERD